MQLGPPPICKFHILLLSHWFLCISNDICEFPFLSTLLHASIHSEKTPATWWWLERCGKEEGLCSGGSKSSLSAYSNAAQSEEVALPKFAYRSPKTFSIGLSPKLVNPLDFHQLRWHFVRKIRWITLKITILGETNSDKIVTCIVTKRGDHTITLIVTNSGWSPKTSPYGVKQKVTKLSHEFSPNTVIIPSP